MESYYLLNKDDELDIISTNKSVYGYLAIGSGFRLKILMEQLFNNYKANIGSNDGKKILVNQKIYINNSKGILKNKEINFLILKLNL